MEVKLWCMRGNQIWLSTFQQVVAPSSASDGVNQTQGNCIPSTMAGQYTVDTPNAQLSSRATCTAGNGAHDETPLRLSIRKHARKRAK
jgi:hypothetical protein